MTATPMKTCESAPTRTQFPEMRFLFYSHDGLGLGHTRRNLAVATALSQLAPQASILVVTGADDVSRLGRPPNVEILKLPGLRKLGNGCYCSRRLRLPETEIRALRSELMLAAVKSFRPRVILVDKHPVGVGEELLPALDALRRTGGRAVLGLRDILDSQTAVRTEWVAQKLDQRIEQYYDLVLVYGHPNIFDPVAEYAFPPPVSARTRYCGYVVNGDQGESRPQCIEGALTLTKEQRPVVLASVGGGEDGFFLLEKFIRAAAQSPWQGVAVAGPMLPANELKRLTRLASKCHVPLHTLVPNLTDLFWSADAMVCMGGYNTLAEALSHGLSTVCVPRTSPRSEQLMRALTFERLGLLFMIHPEQLTVASVCDAVTRALASSRRSLLDRVNTVLSFDGARHAAGHLLALATSKVSTAYAVGVQSRVNRDQQASARSGPRRSIGAGFSASFLAP